MDLFLNKFAQANTCIYIYKYLLAYYENQEKFYS
jgi:hypothetical protein